MLIRRTLLTLAGILWLAPFASAQFYNEARDKKAQQAEAAAGQIANGALFEKETRNIDILSKLQIHGQLDLGRVEWLTALDSLTTWGDVKNKFAEIKSGLGKSSLGTQAERDARLAVITVQQQRLKTALAGLQGSAANDPAILVILDNLDKGEAALKFAREIAKTDNKKTEEAFDRISESLSVAQSLYTAWKKTRDARQGIEAGVAALTIPPEQLELKMLAIEVNQLNQLSIVAAREALESQEVLQLVAMGEGRLKTARVADDAEVETTLRETKSRENLFFQLEALHLAVAASVRNTLPTRLASLRETQEEWRRSVRESSTVAKNYEQIILASAQRLALYYKGGIKPGQIAQLLYNLSGLVSLPIIAAK